MGTNIEPDKIMTNFLRAKLTDVNGSRSGQWIFPDFPRYEDLGDNSFPRIGITIINSSSTSMGIFDDTQWENITLQIDIFAKKEKIYSVTKTDESLGVISNSPRLTYKYIPTSITNIKHNGTAFSGSITRKTTNSVFTTPSSLSAGDVEYSASTGDLNFSSSDLISYSGQTITSTYIIKLEGKAVCQYLAREVIKAVRGSWRTDSTFNGLFYPVLLNNVPIPFDEEFGVFRQTVEYKLNAINLGEGL